MSNTFLGADAVAEHGERRTDLGLRRRGLEVVDLGVGEVADIADRGDAVPRQNIEGVGERRALRRWRLGAVLT
jgi:hypothetical protein